jgi:hypothetical protein
LAYVFCYTCAFTFGAVYRGRIVSADNIGQGLPAIGGSTVPCGNVLPKPRLLFHSRRGCFAALFTTRVIPKPRHLCRGNPKPRRLRRGCLAGELVRRVGRCAPGFWKPRTCPAGTFIRSGCATRGWLAGPPAARNNPSPAVHGGGNEAADFSPRMVNRVVYSARKEAAVTWP